MIAADLSISLGGSLLLFFSFAALLVGLAILFYRYTLPPLPGNIRFILSLLRSLTLLLLLLVIFEPIARLVSHNDQRPSLAVLIDNSQSMTIKDGTGDRKQQLENLIHSGFPRDLPPGLLVRYYPFASKLQSNGSASLPPLGFDGEITNLSEAMSNLKSTLARENIQAAVIVSDGNYTTGKNPLYDAEALGIPVYTVGVGDTNEQKDIVIEKITTNSVAYAGTRTPIDVTVRSSGFDGDRVEITLNEGSTVLDRATITLQQATHRYTTKMHFVPKEEGTKKLAINISQLPGELTERNNTRSVFIKVLKNKLNVFIVSGAPNPDVSAIRQALSEDEHFAVRTYVQKQADEFYEGQFTQTALDSADCIAFIGFPSAASGNTTIQKLRDGIVRLRKPVLFINSKTTDYAKLQLLESFLPFTWGGVTTSELLVGLSVADRNKHHTLIELENKFTAENWQQLPPIYKTQTVFHAKPESETLALVVLQNINLDEPLVLLRSIYGHKSFAITGYGVWRWRLLAEGNAQTQAFLPALLSNAVRWLTTIEDNKRVRIATSKDAFTTADDVEFTGQVYDEQLRPVDNADVIVQIDRGGTNIPVALTALGNGLYTGIAEGLTAGDYTFTGTASRNGASLGQDRGKFSVGQVNVEFLETKMNKQLLEQIAYRTGGTYRNLIEATEISHDLSTGKTFETKELTQASELELWNWKYLAGIVITLFCIEWFLRKRNGML
jgi:hypothetical protein